MKTKVGLLIDLNAFPRFNRNEFVFCEDENNFPEDDRTLPPEVSSCCNDIPGIDPTLESKLNQVEEFVLEQLTREGTKFGKFEPGDVNFAYRYFNSSNYFHPVKEIQSFVPLNLNSYELFEKSLKTEIRSIYESDKDFAPAVNKINFVSSAFKGMISDLDWSAKSLDVSVLSRSASTSSIKSSKSTDSISTLNDSLDETSSKNIIYVFFRVPRDEDDMYEFVDDVPDKLDISTSSKKFLNAFIPKAFLDLVNLNYQIRVNFVDMWFLDGSKSEKLNYPTSISKVLQYLHGGQILSPISRMAMDPGLPNWKAFLKNNLKSHFVTTSAQIINVSSGSETTPSSSRCSTPTQSQRQSQSQAPSKLHRIMRYIQGSSSKSDLGRKGQESDKCGLRKDALLNSQAHCLSFSQPSLLSKPSIRVRRSFSTKSNQTILLRKSNKPILPLSQSMEFLQYNSNDAGHLEDLTVSCPNPKKVCRNLFSANVSPGMPSESIQRLIASTAQFKYTHKSPSRSSPSSCSGSISRNLFRSPSRSSPSSRSGSISKNLFRSPSPSPRSPCSPIQPGFKSPAPGCTNKFKGFYFH